VNFTAPKITLFRGIEIVEVQNQMCSDTKDHHHQKDDNPIHRVFQQRKINDIHRLRSRTLLVNTCSGPEHRKPDGYHEYHRDPVGGVPI
jgi:hypothetical protein